MVDYYWVYHITGFLPQFSKVFPSLDGPDYPPAIEHGSKIPFFKWRNFYRTWRFNGDEIIENPL